MMLVKFGCFLFLFVTKKKALVAASLYSSVGGFKMGGLAWFHCLKT